MSCKDLIPGDFGCASSKGPTMEIASETIGLDLSKPIDLSAMTVLNASVIPIEHNGQKKWLNTAELGSHIFNEDGDQEWIEITIKRRSNGPPKFLES